MDPVFDLQRVNVYYAGVRAVADIDLEIAPNQITALIGPSGCGKTSLIRCLNRMNDLVPIATVTGRVLYHGEDIYDPDIDPVEIRKRIGMVFQAPNPFPTMSVYENVAAGLTLNVRGITKAEKDEIVERSLRGAHLWDEVKNRLDRSGIDLSGGQQQRLCIARALAVDPDVILMDEPCSALDPIATSRIEDLMLALKEELSIVVVTHNLQQAGRVSDMTAFLSVDLEPGHDHRVGRLIEYEKTEKLFTQPGDKRTEDYVTGKVG